MLNRSIYFLLTFKCVKLCTYYGIPLNDNKVYIIYFLYIYIYIYIYIYMYVYTLIKIHKIGVRKDTK